MTHLIYNDNIKEWAKNYDGPLFDGILCDPPYELGFMGKSWDSSGIAFDVEMWGDIYKLLKPGAHVLAFSGSRTYHRMAVAIEDAGFEIRDMIEWVYGSGFPKSLNIGKAVDKIQGNERVEVEEEHWGRANRSYETEAKVFSGNRADDIKDGKRTVSKGTSDYEGYGTALKPAHEPCVLARKPLEKGHNVAQNALKHGTGGLNIDGTRVETQEGDEPKAGKRTATFGTQETVSGGDGSGGFTANTLGRFPANLIHDGSDEVEAVFPQTKAATSRTTNKTKGVTNFGAGDAGTVFNDGGGSASRFFYTAKASKSERDAGMGAFEEKQFVQFQTGNGASGKPSSISEGRNTAYRNHHPTVKPLSLTKYLATLIKPPTGGRLLVPFSGSGSEMIGALQAGWEEVVGVELTEEYIPIAEARIKYWLEQEPKQASLL